MKSYNFITSLSCRLLTSEQARQTDQYTIQHKDIKSVDLMENAAKAFVKAFIKRYPDRSKVISVYCGTGNNGGDGLAIARLLSIENFQNISVQIALFSQKKTDDFQVNFDRLKEVNVPYSEFKEGDIFPDDEPEILIDALLGSGINKPLAGDWQRLAEHINNLEAEVVSVDIPTGFPPEGVVNPDAVFIKADFVITFQRSKINFLLPESVWTLNEFEVVGIGLDEEFIQNSNSPFYFLTEDDVLSKLRKRTPFSHKGTYGHALIIAGASQTMGAALLCAEACLNTGAGLTTACIPRNGLNALNTRCPEVMAVLREEEFAEIEWGKYASIAVGPGLGTSAESIKFVAETIDHYKKSIVFDADALNILAENADLISLIPDGSILTPHLKEFDRLFGEHQSWWHRLETGLKKAQEMNCIIVLKNRYTIIFSPDGKAIFNPTGHPAMATGGTGDVLTGMITAFLAQGYNSKDAAILGVYLHGKTGENLAKKGMFVVPAGKLIENISETIASLMY